MEKAIYLTRTNQIPKAEDNFDIIYFGEEFCDWLVPSPKDYLKAVTQSIDMGKKCSCILPYFTESNIDKLAKILNALKKFHCEIIVNDFGSLFFIHKNFSNFTPVLGRLLTKQRRCIPINSKEKLLLREKEYLSTTAINLPVEKLLKKYKIKRMEIDNLIGGIKPLSPDSNLKQSLYYPYGYLTTTHHCFFTYENGHWRKKIKN
ncbi:hypothetical protein HZA55_10265, partial [Candidatus Poribacteria bacterium]|nr:hypothetical protein [Candidatus Poribacteria bacterium]